MNSAISDLRRPAVFYWLPRQYCFYAVPVLLVSHFCVGSGCLCSFSPFSVLPSVYLTLVLSPMNIISVHFRLFNRTLLADIRRIVKIVEVFPNRRILNLLRTVRPGRRCHPGNSPSAQKHHRSADNRGQFWPVRCPSVGSDYPIARSPTGTAQQV